MAEDPATVLRPRFDLPREADARLAATDGGHDLLILEGCARLDESCVAWDGWIIRIDIHGLVSGVVIVDLVRSVSDTTRRHDACENQED